MSIVPLASRKDLVRAIPKVELHCHLESAMSKDFIESVASRNDLAHLLTDAVRAYDAADFADYLDGYDAGARLLRRPQDFAEAIVEYLRTAGDNGVVYAEVFFSPMVHLDDGVSYRTQLEGLVDGIEQSEAGVRCTLIPAIDRSRSVERAEELVDDILAHRHDLVVGVGLDYDERDGPAAKFSELFGRIRTAGLHVTAHAGETADAAAVLDSIDLLGCERIDHGYSILDDDAALQRCRELGITFTVSSRAVEMLRRWGIGVGGTPTDMWRRGLSISPATDAPTHYGTTLNDELEILVDDGLTLTDALNLQLKSTQAIFLDDGERAALARLIHDGQDASTLLDLTGDPLQPFTVGEVVHHDVAPGEEDGDDVG